MPRLKLSELRMNFQGPECLLEEVVLEKVRLIEDGETQEPIVVRFDGESYFVQDGFHRVEAARRLGLSEIDAEILPGTLEDMEAEFREMVRRINADLKEGK